ncbi:MAG: hypothetical protein DRJ69_06600 [Thermoprotei archaeon]|nr:MAG: hypothetical protein DRJ69_06600 [Thermoprotei archaeon]
MGSLKMKGPGRLLTCPRCGFTFDVSYARTFACRGCPSSVSGCGYMRRPSCGYEWPFSDPLTY